MKTKKMQFIVSLSGAVGFFLAIAPVLDPYIVAEIGSGFTIKINDVLMLIITVFCFAKSYKFDLKAGFLCMWLIGLGAISIFANLFSGTNIQNSFKNLFVWMIYAVCLSYIWKIPCRDKFFYWLERIAIFASVLVLIQFIAGYIGIPVWNGRLPGLALSKYDGWAGYIDRNTGDIRPNGFFQEASYFGIYVSIAYAQAFKKEKIGRMVLYAVTMVMTTSIVAIFSLAAITLVMLVLQHRINITSKTTREIVLLIAFSIALVLIVGSTNDAIGNSLAYIIKRIANFSSDLNGTRMSSTKYRIVGYLGLFTNYSGFQKLFGVGIAQYGSLFGVNPYSNVWVTTILNSGIIGALFLLCCIVKLFKQMQKSNIAFFVIFLIVISSDWQWFSWYFFALISASILRNKSEKVD